MSVCYKTINVYLGNISKLLGHVQRAETENSYQSELQIVINTVLFYNSTVWYNFGTHIFQSAFIITSDNVG